MDAPSDPSPSPIQQLLSAVRARRGVLIALATLAGFALAAHLAWRSAAPTLSESDRFRVTPSRVEASPPPDWVDGDVVQQAFLQAGMLDGVSILDGPEQLEQRVASALLAHPWVSAVESIHKTPPNGLRVELTYRSPLAVVIHSGDALPIDAEAVVLPRGRLTAAALSHLPRIEGASLDTREAVTGQPWRDASLRGAVSLIAALGAAWHELSLFELRIEATLPDTGPSYVLRSTGGAAIRWGVPPGIDSAGESPFKQKLADLRGFVDRHGPLDSVDTCPEWIDVRSGVKAQRRVVKNESPDGAEKDIVK